MREGRPDMKKSFWLAGARAVALASPASAGDTIKIGFVSTFSGPTAVIGNDMRNSFELALDHLGRKIDGKPVEVIYEDDQQKPDVGKQKTEKLIQADKVDFIVGYIWSNVLLASLKTAVDSKTFLISANAGPSQRAGELFSAELTKAKHSKAEWIFVFYPGAAGVQFLNQYAQAGLKPTMPLYTAFTIDELSLPLQKENALGGPGA